jgi:fused signal recognition particle receptor
MALKLLASRAVDKESPKRKFGFIECMILEIHAMFSFFKKKSPPVEVPSPPATPAPPVAQPVAPTPTPTQPEPAPAPAARQGWLDRLKAGLRKTGSSITTVFTGTRIDDELYEELETALLVADTGVKATEHLLQDLKRRVKEAKATEPSQVKTLLADAITDLLSPLQKPLSIGDHKPTVIMVARAKPPRLAN